MNFLYRYPLDQLNNNQQIFFFFVAFSCLFYSCFDLLKHVAVTWKIDYLHDEKERRKISMRIASSVHATTVTLLSIWNLIHNEELHNDKLLFISPEISLILNIVMGYMAYDAMVMLMYEELYELVSLFHHFVSVSAFYACSNIGVFTFIAIFRLTSEGSTSFINNRFLLLSFKKKDSIWYTINGFLVFFSFFVFRVIPILPIWYSFYLGAQTPQWDKIHGFFKILCCITSIPLDVLNVYWFGLIFRKISTFFAKTRVVKSK